MYLATIDSSTSIDDFVAGLSSALRKRNEKQLTPHDWTGFEQSLKAILSAEDSLGIMAEALVAGGWIEKASSQSKRTRQTKTRIPHDIAEAIASSRGILDLKYDWDEQDSPGYEEATWQRAWDFLVRQANFPRESLGRDLPVPRILPGPHGSIDVHWKMPRFELLVNIPKDTSKPATFYGDDFGNSSIRGHLNPAEAIPGLVVWLLT